MAITMDGIFVNGQQAVFHPENILSGDASAYTEEIGTAVEAWLEENVTGGEQVTDTTLTLPGVPADAKETGDRISAVKEDLNAVQPDLITNDIRSAILYLASKVAYIDDSGQTYYDALHDALYPPKALTSISAIYTQDGVVYSSASLDSLKSNLVVTATWDDESTSVLSDDDYTLTGTLTAGTSTITVTYGNKTTTFSVTVTATPTSFTFYDYLTRNDTENTMPANSGIITDIGFTTEDTLTTSFMWTKSQSTACSIMGIRNGQTGRKNFALFCYPSTGQMGYWYDAIDGSVLNYPFTDSNKLYNIAVQPVGVSETYPTHATINVNGVDYDTGSTATGVTFQSWLGFFKYGTSATTTSNITTDRFCGQRIGRTVIKNAQGTILHDLRPANNGTYNGLYDTVGDKFYYQSDYYSYYVCGNWEAA